MEQYRYPIEELVADETAAENKRLDKELKEKEFEKQKVVTKDSRITRRESALKKWGQGSRALSSLRLNNELRYWLGTPGFIVKIKDNAILIILKRF